MSDVKSQNSVISGEPWSLEVAFVLIKEERSVVSEIREPNPNCTVTAYEISVYQDHAIDSFLFVIDIFVLGLMLPHVFILCFCVLLLVLFLYCFCCL